MERNPEIVEVKAEFTVSERGLAEILKAWRDFLETTTGYIRSDASMTVLPPKEY